MVRATDSGGLSSQQTVAINLVDGPDAPVITNLTTSQSTITEGSQLRLSGTFKDPDAEDVHTVTINWGDGTVDVISNDNLSLPDAEGNKSFANLRHTYQDDGQYSITVTVEDGGGSVTQQVTSVAVNNVPPTITQGATLALTVNEDSPTTFTLNATDPGRQDTLTWRILNQPANGTASVSTSPTGKTQTIAYTPTANFAGNDAFEVQVQDNDGGFDTILVNVAVAPQPDPPTTLSLSGNVDALNEGESFTLTGSFADPDLGDSFTVTINWGDGSPATVLPNSRITALGNGNYTFSTSHIFQADSGAGEFSISAIVRDGAGFTVSDTLSLPVVNVPPSIEEGAFLALNTQEDEAITFTLNAADPADTSFEWSVGSARPTAP
ncbi:MAG: cadherin-like domain-containing protein [Leptolyngbyaceae cyanobacterium SM2_5_2]|nr:cadherin-like domain-containing protein [Leptolyngbyaceae cyanobacterium SM2_5_2]